MRRSRVVVGVEALDGRELDQIGTHDVPHSTGPAQDRQRLPIAEPARRRRARRRHDRGIQRVDVERHVHRPAGERPDDLLDVPARLVLGPMDRDAIAIGLGRIPPPASRPRGCRPRPATRPDGPARGAWPRRARSARPGSRRAGRRGRRTAAPPGPCGAPRRAGWRRRSANALRPARTGTCRPPAPSRRVPASWSSAGLDRTCDRRLAQGRHAVVEIGLAPQLVVVKLELLAGRQDRRRPSRRAAAVADGRFEAERYDDGPRGCRICRHPRGLGSRKLCSAGR